MKNILKYSNFKYLILIVFSFLLVFSFHPSIMKLDEYTGNIINPFSKYINIVFCILFIINTNKIKLLIKCPLIRDYMLIMSMVLIYAALTAVFIGNKFIWWEVRSLTMCLVAIIIGFNLNISDKQMSNLLTIYAVSGLIVGISIVMTNIGGFKIIENNVVTYKNAIGVVLSTASIISFYMSFERDKYVKLYRIFLLIISIILVMSILTIRARAAALLTLVSFVIILYLKNKGKNKEAFLITIVAIVLLVIVMPQNVENFIMDSFFKGFEEKDITSDRGRRNQQALLFLKDNLLVGNINRVFHVDQIHNYPLRILFNGGIIFSFPILLLYVYLLIKIISCTIKENMRELKNIGFIAIIIPFGISMLEPTLPFGPGATTVFSFMLLGIALKNKYEKKYLKNE